MRDVSSEIFSSMHSRSSHVGKMHANSLGQLPMTGVGEEERTRQNNAIFKLRARNEVFRLRDEKEEKRKRDEKSVRVIKNECLNVKNAKYL